MGPIADESFDNTIQPFEWHHVVQECRTEMNDVIHEMDEQMHHDIEECGREVNLKLAQYHDDPFLQRVELLQADRFP
jgi:hypothetical protein